MEEELSGEKASVNKEAGKGAKQRHHISWISFCLVAQGALPEAIIVPQSSLTVS